MSWYGDIVRAQTRRCARKPTQRQCAIGSRLTVGAALLTETYGRR